MVNRFINRMKVANYKTIGLWVVGVISFLVVPFLLITEQVESSNGYFDQLTAYKIYFLIVVLVGIFITNESVINSIKKKPKVQDKAVKEYLMIYYYRNIFNVTMGFVLFFLFHLLTEKIDFFEYIDKSLKILIIYASVIAMENCLSISRFMVSLNMIKENSEKRVSKISEFQKKLSKNKWVEKFLKNEMMRKILSFLKHGNIKFKSLLVSMCLFLLVINALIILLVFEDFKIWLLIYLFSWIIIIPIFVGTDFFIKKSIKRENERLEKFQFKNFDISSENIVKYPIYVMKSNRKSVNYYMFKLDLENLFPKDAKERVLIIENGYKPVSVDKNEVDNLGEFNNILICIDIDEKVLSKVQDFKFHLGFKTNSGEINYRYYRILVNLSCAANVLVPMEKYLVDYTYKVLKKSILLKSLDSFSLGELEEEEIFRKIIIDATSRIYFFEKIDEELSLKDKVVDNRKILLHDNKLGSGKTTYDVISVVSQEKIPIVISPWEANYDHDILQLIFNAVRKQTNTKRFNSEREYNIFFWGLFVTAFTICFTWGKWIIDYFMGILKLSNKSFPKSFTGLSIRYGGYFVILILVYVGVRQVYKKILPNLIVFKKDNTKVYKDFYINSIVHMLLKNENYILIIEDIDRLNEAAQDEVFRILSLINSNLPRQSHIFALLSYDADNIKKNSGDIQDKIIFGAWGENQNEKDAMNKYLITNIEVISKMYGCEGSELIPCCSAFSLINAGVVSFRDIYSFVRECVEKMSREKVEMSKEKIKNIFKTESNKLAERSKSKIEEKVKKDLEGN